MAEIWKDIKGFEGCYKISSHGRVMALGRCFYFNRSDGGRKHRTIKTGIHTQCLTRVGYCRVCFCVEAKRSYLSVHRLVAQAFIPNPYKLPQINHIDGNKLNNHVSNLEWCDQSHNQQHAYDMGLNIPKKSWEDSQSHPIAMLDLKGRELRRFGSFGEAKRETGIARTCIRRVCDGDRASYKNYKFRRL